MMLFGGNHRRGTTTRTPQTRTTVVHNTIGDFLVSETTGGLPTAKMHHHHHHHHHRSDEEATARRRSSPPSTTTTTTNAERLWELQRELAKELIFSENDGQPLTCGDRMEISRNQARANRTFESRYVPRDRLMAKKRNSCGNARRMSR